VVSYHLNLWRCDHLGLHYFGIYPGRLAGRIRGVPAVRVLLHYLNSAEFVDQLHLFLGKDEKSDGEYVKDQYLEDGFHCQHLPLLLLVSGTNESNLFVQKIFLWPVRGLASPNCHPVPHPRLLLDPLEKLRLVRTQSEERG